MTHRTLGSLALGPVLLGALACACSSEAPSGADDSGGSVQSSSGGSPATGGVGGTGGSSASGGAEPAGGGPSAGGNVAGALDELRLDDPCAGNPTVSVGATCDHVGLTGAGFHAQKTVSIAGSEGVTYDVTLRVRGVVEPTNVVGGSRSDGGTFEYMNLDWRTAPYTQGGEVPSEDTDYAQWRILVGNPARAYFLNDYQRVGHYIFRLDYELTIPLAAHTTVTLDVSDDNERQILNYEGYELDGLSGSSNFGQFLQLDVISVVPQ